MFETLRIWPQIRTRILSGPLGPHVGPYVSTLHQRGYTKRGLRVHVRGVDAFGIWLAQHGLSAEDINESAVEHFVVSLGRVPSSRSPRGRLPEITAVARRFARFLWAQGLADRRAASPNTSSADPWLRSFDDYLDQVKGLSCGTRKIYLRYARRFLETRFATRKPEAAAIRPDDVVDFVQEQAVRLKPSARRGPVTAFRAFLRFLAFRGEVEASLEKVVPTIREWKHAALPSHLSTEEIKRVLAKVQGSGRRERRNRAMLLLLARLGLRASEVAAIELRDVDWRQGLLYVRAGKTGRPRSLPLPHEVGQALGEYLRHARPKFRHSRLFLRAHPPDGPVSSAAVSQVAKRVLTRAGIQTQRAGAHVFRHSAATHMVRHGASFKEIADVLGHARIETTTLYAKLDVETLARVALPWPGGEG